MKTYTLLGALAASVLTGCCTIDTGSPTPDFQCGAAKKIVLPAPVLPDSGTLAVVYGSGASHQNHETDWTLNGTDWHDVGDAPKVLKKGPHVVQFWSRVQSDLPPAGIKFDIKPNTATTIVVSYKPCPPGGRTEPSPGSRRTTRSGRATLTGDSPIENKDTGHVGPINDLTPNPTGSSQLQVVFKQDPKRATNWNAGAGWYAVGVLPKSVVGNRYYGIQYVCTVSGHTGPGPHTVYVPAGKLKQVQIYYTNP